MNENIVCFMDVLLTSSKYSDMVQFSYKIYNIEKLAVIKDGTITMPFGKDLSTSTLIRTGFKYEQPFNNESFSKEKEKFFAHIAKVLKFVYTKNLYVVTYNEQNFKEILRTYSESIGADYSESLKFLNIKLFIDKFELSKVSTDFPTLDTTYVDIFGFEKYLTTIKQNKWGNTYVETIINECIDIFDHILQLSETRNANEMFENMNKPVLLKRFTSGKYSGELIDDIIRNDPEYIAYLIKHKTVGKNNPNLIYTLRFKLSQGLDNLGGDPTNLMAKVDPNSDIPNEGDN